MAEPRRVPLTTLAAPACHGPPVAPHVAPPSQPQPQQPPPEPEPRVDTVRFVLSLFEPDERRFPEFSYSQLVEGKVGPPAEEEAAPRCWEDEERLESEQLALVARRLEQKYGDKPKKKKKKKDRVQDLIDIGYGYDDEDSFIDNSEPYDEFVPSAITTKFGGFYVNSGVLQFREASDSEDHGVRTVEEEDDDDEEEEEEEGTPEPPKKRKLLEGQEKQKKKKKKPCRANGEQGGVDVSVCEPGAEGEEAVRKKKKQKKKPSGPLSVTSMLRKFQREKERERQRMEKARVLATPTMALCPADAAGGGGSGLADPLLSLIGSTNDHALIQAASAADFDLDLDCLLGVGEEAASPRAPASPREAPSAGGPQTPSRKSSPPPGPPPEPLQLLPDTKTAPQVAAAAPTLDGLPPPLEDTIRKLMLAAKTLEGEPKPKYFSPEINALLLEIEAHCRGLGVSMRSRVLTHLSSFLPCSREALYKRLKRLTLTYMEERPMEDHLQKLKEAVGRAMPEQLACFHESCRVYEQLKTSKSEDGREEEGVEERGGKRGPRKWFKWNEEIRECLGHVLREKMDVYQQEGKGGIELEEQLKAMLESEVKPLWPRGWIQSRVLIRESRKMLGLFSSLPVKKAPADRKPPEGSVSLQGPPPPKDPAEVNSITSASLPPDLHVFSAAAAVGRDHPLPASQQLLVAAVTKYKCSLQQWSLAANGGGSPPLPPPPPQSSPVSFLPGRAAPPFPQLPRDFGKHWDADEVTIISDDDAVIQ